MIEMVFGTVLFLCETNSSRWVAVGGDDVDLVE